MTRKTTEMSLEAVLIIINQITAKADLNTTITRSHSEDH